MFGTHRIIINNSWIIEAIDNPDINNQVAAKTQNM